MPKREYVRLVAVMGRKPGDMPENAGMSLQELSKRLRAENMKRRKSAKGAYVDDAAYDDFVKSLNKLAEYLSALLKEGSGK